MATQASIDKVQTMYVAYYGRPGDPAGVTFWADVLDGNNGDWTPEIVDAFGTSAEFTERFATDEEGNPVDNTVLITELYQNMFNRAPEQAGLDFYLGLLEEGTATLASIALDIANGAQGLDLEILNNKVEVAGYYTEQVIANDAQYDSDDIDAAVDIIKGVTHIDASVDSAKSQVDEALAQQGGQPGEGFLLTVDQDNLVGTSGNDLFESYIFDNQNTFQSGDRINGGAGIDELYAELGDSSYFAIRGHSTDVEKVFFTSQSTNEWGSSGNNNVDTTGDKNTVDAERMVGVKEWWNTDSRADLKIEDIRILPNEITKDITIGLRNTDPGSMDDYDDYYEQSDDYYEQSYETNKVDFEVYFSPESLRPEAEVSTAALTLVITNPLRVSDGFNPDTPLKDVPYTQVAFSLDGETIFLDLDLENVETYDELFEALQTAVSTRSELNGMTIERNVDSYPFFSTDGEARVADEFILRFQSHQLEPVTPGWLAEGGLPPDNAFTAIVKAGDSVVTDPLITSTIILDNVGREDEAGSLTIGSMSTHGGVERFEITVENNDDNAYAGTQSGSWLSHMSSTNNTLQEVKVVNAAAGIENPDYLYLGTNMDQDGNNLHIMQDWPGGLDRDYDAITAVTTSLLNPDGLSDVRLFDASEMKGDVYVGAQITDAATRKYQDLVDHLSDDQADDVAFQYLTGDGDDSINLELDAGWAVANSRVIPGRHDFSFLADGGAGDDNIQVRIVNGLDGNGLEVLDFKDDWYNNQSINANVVINGGDGNDTIRTPGAGSATINGGTGNDSIYVDNTGESDGNADGYNNGHAAWVFNTADLDPSGVVDRDVNVGDLSGDAPASVSAVNAQLTVTFMGFEKTVAIADSVGKFTNVEITDLHINQAIKDAINQDNVLNKLLKAVDGPGRSLIIQSLIDGQMNDGKQIVDNLKVSFSTAPLTAQQTAPGLVLFSTATAATPALLDGFTPGDDALFGTWFGDETDGGDSEAHSDNRIEGGKDNDVIVLGTGEHSNDTVVYTGFNNGTDRIVNFQSGLIGDVAATTESVLVTFSGVEAGSNTTIDFDGVTVNLVAGDAVSIATQFVAQYVGGTDGWLASNNGDGTVTLTAPASGAIADLTAADFVVTDAPVGTADTTAVAVTISDNVDGNALDAETFSATFSGVEAGGDTTITFDGVTIVLPAGNADGIASAVAGGAYTNWTAAVDGGDNTKVNFTAISNGDGPNVSAEDFVITDVVSDTEISASVLTLVQGAPATLGETETGIDFLDFGAYDAKAVAVNGVAVLGTLPTTGVYINLVESNTNDGEYTINHVDLGALPAATDDVVTLIGVADFGIEQAFNANNFII
jgi:hypothetical protein